jgi:hypothetical protein
MPRVATTKAYSLRDAPAAVHEELMVGINAILDAKSDGGEEHCGSDGRDLLRSHHG